MNAYQIFNKYSRKKEMRSLYENVDIRLPLENLIDETCHVHF